jgi:very-short-patch-repair endonuclease
MATQGDIDQEIHGECHPRGEEAVQAWALRQHGVVTRAQLTALGFGKGAIDHRVATGRLHPVHRGVYAYGLPRLNWHGRALAAVLACGPGAVLSHRSAAALWDLVSGVGARVDVTTPGRRRGRNGVRLHRAGTLDADDRVVREGVPATSVARTLLDLGDVMPAARLAHVVERADRLRILDMRAVERVCARSPGRRGLRPLTVMLAEGRDPPDTRSSLERRFIDFCRRQGLPTAAVNVTVAGHVVDALWPGARLIVELDGFAYHRTRRMFEADRVRDGELQLAGYRVLRITSRRLEEQPAAVADTVRAMLGQVRAG